LDDYSTSTTVLPIVVVVVVVVIVSFWVLLFRDVLYDRTASIPFQTVDMSVTVLFKNHLALVIQSMNEISYAEEFHGLISITKYLSSLDDDGTRKRERR